MKTSYIFLAFIGILMYNVFLIQRDQKMFGNHETPKEKYCQQQAGWHPDCNLE